jgi:hypothetical protein
MSVKRSDIWSKVLIDPTKMALVPEKLKNGHFLLQCLEDPRWLQAINDWMKVEGISSSGIIKKL